MYTNSQKDNIAFVLVVQFGHVESLQLIEHFIEHVAVRFDNVEFAVQLGTLFGRNRDNRTGWVDRYVLWLRLMLGLWIWLDVSRRSLIEGI